MFGLIIINSTNLHGDINGIVELIRNISRKEIRKVFHELVQNNKVKAHVSGHKHLKKKKQLCFTLKNIREVSGKELLLKSVPVLMNVVSEKKSPNQVLKNTMSNEVKNQKEAQLHWE